MISSFHMSRADKPALRSEINSRARVHNKGAVNRAADLHPLATQYGANGPNFPANFPTTLHDVYSLRGKFVKSAA